MSDILFPSYTRDEKRNVKLSLEQVEQLRSDFKMGKYSTKRELGEAYGITGATASYWLMNDDERAAKNKKRNNNKRTYNLGTHTRYLKRKREFDNEAIVSYRSEVNRRAKKNKSLQLKLVKK